MEMRNAVSRRSFVGGMAAVLGYLGFGSDAQLLAETQASGARAAAAGGALDAYDAMAKLGNNENPWGPPDSVMQAMTQAFKYANRYGYPDGGIVQAIADHHGVKRENVLLGAGSGEILQVVGSAFLQDNRKVLGVEPTFATVYQHATNIKADSIRLPLTADYRQDMSAMIKAARTHYRELGFVYLCNPNNPTGAIVTKQEVKQLLDGIPEDMPVLIDEAYHHFVEDPNYATSVPYVLEGRPVIIARTFSKIVGLAGMRLGYAVAPAEIITRMRPWAMNSINAIVKWGGVAALKDTAAQAKVKADTIMLRKKASTEIEAMGYSVIPSEANFIMVGIKRQVQPVIEEFRGKGVIVGRPFPPMLEHLRVSIGTAEEMDRFMVAFKQIFPAVKTTTAARG
jgi:histidinol-phosphate aminotransferase